MKARIADLNAGLREGGGVYLRVDLLPRAAMGGKAGGGSCTFSSLFQLDVIVMHGFDPLSLASALGSIATDPPQAVIGDGESWGETPITMKVLPSALRVIAPGVMQK